MRASAASSLVAFNDRTAPAKPSPPAAERGSTGEALTAWPKATFERLTSFAVLAELNLVA